jgi:hypothetical protein
MEEKRKRKGDRLDEYHTREIDVKYVCKKRGMVES